MLPIIPRSLDAKDCRQFERIYIRRKCLTMPFYLVSDSGELQRVEHQRYASEDILLGQRQDNRRLVADRGISFDLAAINNPSYNAL
jgi:hypothetical protein